MKSLKCREPDSVMREWPEQERPVSKLHEKGPAALSDAELLAVMLRTGTKDMSAVDLARSLLTKYGSLSIAMREADELMQDQSARLTAATELVRRALWEKMSTGSSLASPSAVREYLRLHLQHLPHEAFVAIFLNGQNHVIAFEELFRGTLTQTSVYPREVVKRALHHNAAAIVVAHNHPSGVAQPSVADEMLTQALKQALALVDVRVMDHFIVAGSGILSFAERGLI